MKELTFKEVIANIKKGEIWENPENRISKIYINCAGNIQFEGTDDTFAINYSTCVSPNAKYKLQRKEYSFEEAFKSLKEGKEIENLLTGKRLKMIDNKIHIWHDTFKWFDLSEIGVFTFKEINSKWYIND